MQNKYPEQIQSLPITPHLDEICNALKQSPSRFLVLTAETGAGKSTALPLALLENFQDEILMLEPRRLAALAIANRVAELKGEECGKTVGYKMFLESKTSENTRLTVMTEAILTKRIQRDPSLEGISAVILDEFHERSVHTDLALAFLKEAMQLRDDLYVIIMSATIDTGKLSSFLGTENEPAPVMHVSGRTFPVDIQYDEKSSVAQAVLNELSVVSDDDIHKGSSILVFLPGLSEIRKCMDALSGTLQENTDFKTSLHMLHSSINISEQKKILQPAEPDSIRIILSTSIAETSLTVPDVITVIDSGLSRISRMNLNLGMSRLVTETESEFSALQRTGRAGRTQRGKCIRLWNKNDLRQKDSLPEIERADLSSLVLECTEWGVKKASGLQWLDPPPEAAWAASVQLLQSMKCLDKEGAVTPTGKAVLKLGISPRLACTILAGTPEEALPFSQYKESAPAIQKQFCSQMQKRLSSLDSGLKNSIIKEKECLLAGFPDRIAIFSPEENVYQFPSGRIASLKGNPVSPNLPKYIVCPEVDAGQTKGIIYSYKSLEPQYAEKWLSENATTRIVTEFISGSSKVRKTEIRAYGKLILSSKNLPVSQDDEKEAICNSVRKNGFKSLPADERIELFLTKVKFYNQQSAIKIKHASKNELSQNPEEWLLPFLVSGKKISADTVYNALFYYLSGDRVEREVPSKLQLENGKNVKIIYQDGSVIQPVIEIIIQQVFGCFSTPKIIGMPVLMKLLSPARRPLQITQDLEGFWQNTWPEICKEMKGRYPKHNWDYRITTD